MMNYRKRVFVFGFLGILLCLNSKSYASASAAVLEEMRPKISQSVTSSHYEFPEFGGVPFEIFHQIVTEANNAKIPSSALPEGAFNLVRGQIGRLSLVSRKWHDIMQNNFKMTIYNGVPLQDSVYGLAVLAKYWTVPTPLEQLTKFARTFSNPLGALYWCITRAWAIVCAILNLFL